jgi:hypothetical protein
LVHDWFLSKRTQWAKAHENAAYMFESQKRKGCYNYLQEDITAVRSGTLFNELKFYPFLSLSFALLHIFITR